MKETLKGTYARLGSVILNKKGRFFENRERDLEYLRLLDCDRMLYNFRAAFGVENKCEPLGGWEEPKGLLRGHSTGHFLSALALAYDATGEEIFKEKMDYIVAELRKLQKMCGGRARDFVTKASAENPSEELWSRDVSRWGEGFLSAYSPDQFALLELGVKYNKIWAPYYTLHKIMAGLMDCYTRGKNEEALECAVGIANWVNDRLSALNSEKRKEMWSLYIAGEFGGIATTLTELYEITGDKKHLETAKMFDNDNIFPPLSRGEDAVANRHANQHIPQALGALEEYLATGDNYYYDIGKNFFDIVTQNHMYSIGGVGQAESFRDSGRLAANIKGATNCETCVAYNMMKTARLLYALDPTEAKYMDYYERAMINQILASQSPEVTPFRHNGVTYMLPIGPGAEKEYSDDYQSFTCCHGTGMENHVKYQDASFFETEDAVFVNQYIPARLTGETEIALDIDFPRSVGKITVSGEKDRRIYFRVPTWTENPFNLPMAGRYAYLDHKGGETETIDVKFDYSVRLEYTPDELDGRKLASVLYGPFVMVTADEREELITIKKDYIADENEDKNWNWNMEFIPMYQMHGRNYHTYFVIE